MGSDTHASPVEVGAVSGNGAAATEVETERSRRALLKGLGVAAAGAVVGGVLSPEEAEAHGTFHQDSNNADPAIHGNNSSNGPGVLGSSIVGFGVRGTSVTTGVLGQGDIIGVRGTSLGVPGLTVGDTGVRGDGDIIGVEGRSDSGTGVDGRSDNGIGVDGRSDSGTGVRGRTATGIGVEGLSNSFIGVNGFSDTGIGLEGSSVGGTGVIGNGGNAGVIGDSGTNGTGVLAQNSGDGLALDVHGPARFSTAGAGTIPANQNSVAVSDPAVTADSHITITLTGNPGSVVSGVPAVVVWVERQPGTGFTARLSRKVTNATPFTYLIVEPG